MQQAFRATRSVRYGGALKAPSSIRGIHSTAVNPNSAVLVTESRHSTETFHSHDVAQTRAISTGIGSIGSPLTKLRQLGPRAKANFNTSIARQDLGIMPFESNIIFPNLDGVPREQLTEARVPFLPDNLRPARQPEPEYKVARPIIATVADSITHIAAPSAIMEGFAFNISFLKEFAVEKDEQEEPMMRAFRV